jgi:outer membrane lipoprotein-sorting protein
MKKSTTEYKGIDHVKLIVGALAVALLAGCATSPTPSNEAKQAPASQLSAYQAKPSGAYGTMQVIRDSGQTGSLCSMAVFIDGKQAAKLDRPKGVVLSAA